MANFANPFFSIAGQVERLKNAGATIVAAVTGKGVTANTGNKTVDTVLSTAASHPFITAGVAATAVNPTAAVSAAKAVGSNLATSFGNASLTTKAAVVVAAPVAGSALLTSQKARSAIINAPSELSSFGADVGRLVDNPTVQGAKALVKEHTGAAIGLGVAAAAAGAVGVAGLASTAATFANTQAIKANSEIANVYTEQVKGVLGTSPVASMSEKALVPEPSLTKANVAPPIDSSLPSEQPAEQGQAVAEKPTSGGVKNSNKVNILIANQTKSTRNRNIYISKKTKRR